MSAHGHSLIDCGIIMRRFLPLLAVVLLVPLVIAACDTGPTSSLPTVATPRATASPRPPAALTIQRIALPGYHVTEASVMAHGFMFNGWADDGQPHPIGTLYYYSFTSRQVSVLDTAAPDTATGTLRDIHYVRASGDLVTYLRADNNLAFWELAATDAATGQHYTIDSADQEGLRRDLPFQGYIATDGRQIVWTVSGSRNGQFTTAMKVFDTATQTSRTVTSDAAHGFTPAISGNIVVYTLFPLDVNVNTEMSVWQRNLAGGAPVQIATTHANVNIDFNGLFAVWDDVSSGDIQGINLKTGAALPLNGAQCIRPMLSGHRMVCQVIDQHFQLVDLTTGQSTVFAEGESAPYATVSADRVLWWSDTAHAVEFALLPQ